MTLGGRSIRFMALLMAIAVAGALVPAAMVAAKRPVTERYSFSLDPVPHAGSADGGSNAGARVRIIRRGDQVTVTIRAKGLSPNLVHVAHIHGIGQHACPGPDARDDRVDDGLIDTVEGLPHYGPIVVSLTTSGDAGAGSALAVDRFLAADARGRLTYSRTFTVGVDFPQEVADDLAAFHIVMHGIDVNASGDYDLAAGESPLAGGLPLEAEVPAGCGLIVHQH